MNNKNIKYEKLWKNILYILVHKCMFIKGGHIEEEDICITPYVYRPKIVDLGMFVLRAAKGKIENILVSRDIRSD